MAREVLLTGIVHDRSDAGLLSVGNGRSASLRKEDSGELKLVVQKNDGTEEISAVGQISATKSTSGSFQPVAADLELSGAAGSSNPTNPKFLAGVMGNLLGDGLSGISNYLGGVIGHYSVTGIKTTTYPAGAVLGGIGDTVTECDGAFVAYIDGDSGVTKAGAALKVRNNNSTPGSGFAFGVDLFDAAHDGYLAVAYRTADIRLEKANAIKSGSVDPSAGGGVDLPKGSLYLRDNGGVGSTVFYKHGAAATDWTAL